MITVVLFLAFAGTWHFLRDRRKKRGPSPQRRKRAAMLMVVAILGIQAVVTAPQALAAECGAAPNPERPGSGMVGAIDPPRQHGLDGSAYLDYSYAGMVWNVFETNCSPMAGLTDPNSTIDTWGGNQLFNMAKNIVGATNSLHYTVMEDGLLAPIYNAVKTGAEKVYSNIYAQLFGLAALLLSILMFRNIWRGDLSAVSKRALFALAGVWLAASSLALLRYLDPIDDAIVKTTSSIQAGFIDQSDADTIAHEVLPTRLHEQVIYQNWLRGEFGSPDSEQATQFGRPLLDAQAFTWTQMNNDDDANQAVTDAKKTEFKNISTQLGPATGYFTGEDGSRTGAGFLAFLQSLVYSLFQLFAKASVLLAQVLLRLFTLTAPLIGLVAVLHPDILRRVARVLGAVAFNLIVLSVLAGVHALLLNAIFDAGSSLSMLVQMAMAGLVTILLFLVGRPARRLWQMVEMSVSMVGSAVPSPRGGLLSKFRKNSNDPSPQDDFWQNVRDTDETTGTETRGPMGATAGGGRFRPEATVFASSQRLDRTGLATRPAAAWSGAIPGASTDVNGYPGLPGGGSAGASVFGTYGLGNGGGPMGNQLPQPASRRVDTSPVFDRGWDRGDDPEPVVIPSRMTNGPGPQPEGAYAAPQPRQPQVSGMAAPRPVPRRVDAEMVGGRAVHVLYRPSRGLEVREDLRDTDRAVRG